MKKIFLFVIIAISFSVAKFSQTTAAHRRDNFGISSDTSKVKKNPSSKEEPHKAAHKPETTSPAPKEKAKEKPNVKTPENSK